MKIVQITDTHLVPRGEILHGLDPCERLDACIDDINRHHRDAELCIITGDLVHNGQPQAYRDLKVCLSRLKIPCHLLVGNHDHRGRLLDEFPDLPVDENGFLQTVIETGAGRFFLLDTIEQGMAWGPTARNGWPG
jgi:3',5'-cyclic AMP phosphodiesterase CpdA